MDKSEPPLPRWKEVIMKFKQKLRPSGDANEKRIYRRRKVIAAITSRLAFIKCVPVLFLEMVIHQFDSFQRIALFLLGYSWMLLIPFPYIGRGVYIDENALQPGQVCLFNFAMQYLYLIPCTTQVNIDWGWGDVHAADQYLAQLEKLRSENITSEQ